MVVAFALGPAELAVLFVLGVVPIGIVWFVYRAGKNAGRAEAMKEQFERDRSRPPA